MRLTHHAIALFLLVSFASPSRAETFVWTGAIDDRWSTPNNWQGGVSPDNPAVQTRTLVFPAGAAQTEMLNDLGSSIVVHQLRFEAPYVLHGPLRIVDRIEVAFSGAGKVYFTGHVKLESSGLFNTVTFDTSADLEMLENFMSGPSTVTLRKEGTGTMFLRPHVLNELDGRVIVAEGTLDVQYATAMGAMGATVLAGGTLRVVGGGLFPLPLRLAGSGSGGQGALYLPNGGTLTDVTLCCTADATITVGAGHTATIDGAITGSTGLRKSGLGTLILAGAPNTYAGHTTHARGTLVLQKGGAVAVPNGLTIDVDTVRLVNHHAVEGTVTVNTWGVFDVNGHSDIIAALNGNGEVHLLNGSLTVTSPTEDSFFTGSISGGGTLSRIGNASMRLSGLNTFTGALAAYGPGALRVDGTVPAPVLLNGPLRGSGAIGSLTGSGGIVEPGDGSAPGVLSTRSLALGDAVSFAVKVNGPNPGTGYSQLRATGTVTLDQTQLVLSAGGAAAASGTELLIIDNDANDPVTGTFVNLPEGALVSNGGRTFRVSYVGGTGNDVTLTALPLLQHHLSEGATGAFFDTDLLIANPNAAAAPIEVRFLKPGGETVAQSYTVPGLSRMTIRVDDIAGLENTEISTIVTSVDALPIVVERTMRWDATGYGAHTEKAVGGPSTTWYFAEGAQGFFSTYLLLANPHAQANTATVEYLREGGATSIVRMYPLDPSSRFTVDVGADPDLVGHSFGMTVTFALAGVAERSMYFGQSPLWNAGHESAGATAPSTSWFLAEGATGPFFETFVLIANPNDAPTDVTLTFLPDTGVPIAKTKTIPARSRMTVNIEAEDPALANAAVATRVAATLPVVVERAQYWPDPAPQWYEAHNSFGVTEPAVSWGLAEGRVGGPEGYLTYILLANPETSKSADVTMTFLREGKPSFTKTFSVNPTSRFTVSTGPGSLVPELQDERFGVQITAGEPIVVERAMYSNAGGALWSAGTNATATRLP